jgi:hypothetical protein
MRPIAIITICCLVVSSAAHAQSSLPPGKPAGVKPATTVSGNTEYYLFGVAGVVAISLGILLFRGNNTTSSAAATTS